MSILVYTLVATAVLAMLFFTALGMFVCFHLLRSQQSPADRSNRINKIRLFWFVLTREDLFVNTFPWLARDELDNVGG